MDYPTPPLIIYVDVDDTFVRSYGAKRISIPAVLQHIKYLHRQGGVEMYCWSSGGADYARASAVEFGVADCFAAFLPKPHVMIDDQDVSEWRRLLQVHPAGDVAATAEDYRARLADRR